MSSPSVKSLFSRPQSDFSIDRRDGYIFMCLYSHRMEGRLQSCKSSQAFQ
jgi:hypothetical protein